MVLMDRFMAWNTESDNIAIPYTIKIETSQENWVNSVDTLTRKTRAIPSQAIKGIGFMEGVTTTRVSPNNNPLQERPTLYKERRYSLNCIDNIQNHSLNDYELTKLNSIPFSAKIETLSEFDLMDILKEGLLDDFAKSIDGVIERQFNLAPLRYVGTATAGYVLTTNGTATATNSSALNTYHIRKMVLELKKRNVPGWAEVDGDYVMIVSHEAAESILGAVESVNQYTESGYKKILNGEIGRYYGCRFVEDGFATRFTYSATAGTATAKSWTNSLSLEGYMFGSPTVREAIVIPEQVRMKVVTDYGRSKGLAWYFLGGYAIERSDEPNARIIKWDSAA